MILKNKFISNHSNSKKVFFCLLIFLLFEVPFFSASNKNTMSTAEAQVKREQFLAEIKNQIGKRFEKNCTGPDSYDNVGLVCGVAKSSLDIKLPGNVKSIYNEVKIVSDEKKEPGDLLFFKSQNGVISEIGVFIGNDDFVSAVETDENDGVQILSLSDANWKKKYVAVGQFLPSGKAEVVKSEETKTENKKSENKKTENKKEVKSSGDKKQPESFSKNDLAADFSVFFDWSLLSPRQFVFRFRGIDALLNVNYTGFVLEPGLGIAFRYNFGLDTIQIPLTVSMKINDYIRAYAGPVFTCKSVSLIDTDKEIKASIFPGVVGISFISPSYKIGDFEIKGVQDISYTVYNNLDGASLSFKESMAAGLVMYTGVRIACPLSVFGK